MALNFYQQFSLGNRHQGIYATHENSRCRASLPPSSRQNEYHLMIYCCPLLAQLSLWYRLDRDRYNKQGVYFPLRSTLALLVYFHTRIEP